MMAKIEQYLSGDEIYRAGENSRGAYIIETGKGSLYTDKGFQLVTLGEGELFGELGQVVDDQRSVTAKARTDCRLRHIPKNVLNSKFDSADPAIAGMFRALAIRL